eukprot:330236-Chlamydomonas_euryale.AAC.1
MAAATRPMSAGAKAAAVKAAASAAARERNGGGNRNGGGSEEECDDDDGGADSASDPWGHVEPGSPPPRQKGSRLLLACELPGTPEDFFNVLLANESDFLADVLEEQGNRRIDITTWKRAEQLGFIRDVQFTSPIKGAFSNWGVSHTSCFVSQRFCRCV